MCQHFLSEGGNAPCIERLIKIETTDTGDIGRQLAGEMPGGICSASQIHADFFLPQGGESRIVWKGDCHPSRIEQKQAGASHGCPSELQGGLAF